MVRLLLRFAFFFALGFASYARTNAADAFASRGEWTTQPGVPTRTITCVLQTRDGYLWLGSYDGLLRFDGVRFQLFDNDNVSAAHDSGVTSLYEARDGTLWIGHARGGVSRYHDHAFTFFPARAGIIARKIQSLTEDRHGDIWSLDSSGDLWRLRDGLVRSTAGPRTPEMQSLAQTSDGRVFVATGFVLSELIDGQLHEIAVPEAARTDIFPSGLVQGVAPRAEGGCWIVANDALWKFADDRWTLIADHLPLQTSPTGGIVALLPETFFIGTNNVGVLQLTLGDPPQVHLYGRASGWASDWITALYRDHEGNVWLGTGGAGLFRWKPEVVNVHRAPDGFGGRALLTISPARDRGFWVGTEGAGVYKLAADGSWQSVRKDGLLNTYVWSIDEDRDGDLYVGTWENLQIRRGDDFILAPHATGMPSPITAIVPAQAGGFWVGGSHGLVRYSIDEGVVPVEPEASRQLLDIRSILETGDGTVWVTCNGEGLGRVGAGAVKNFRQRDGLPTDFLTGLSLDADSTLWIGTRNSGLVRFRDQRFAVVDVKHGLTDNAVSQIEDDGLGNLWMSTRSGVMRVSKRELNACADGKLAEVSCHAYTVALGAEPMIASPSQAAPHCRTPDGRLFFSMDGGIAEIDPRHVPTNGVVPPILIESVQVGDREASRSEAMAGSAIVPPDEHRLEIFYTAPSFSAPERVRFRHRLVGLDARWVYAGAERHAIYNYIPPGHYTFEVIASNEDNLWSPTPARVEIEVRPQVWQTWPFRALVAVALLALTGVLVWVQARRKLKLSLERLRLERALDAERARIASDMHDDVGAQLTQIAMLTETARSHLSDPAKNEQRLQMIYQTARAITRSMEEIVWAVNPRFDTLESLLSYCEKFAQTFLSSAGLQAWFDFPFDVPTIRVDAQLRHHLFLAYKEALHNVVQHAAATEVTIRAHFSNRELTLAVIDNGTGLVEPSSAEAQKSSRGNGLRNQRARMQRVGGHVTWQNIAPHGCEIVFRVPLPNESRA